MDFFTTTEFMTDLGLDLREQTAFAIIYSFSQDQEGCWYGSISTMSKWLGNCTHATTIHTLKNLVEKGLIIKEDFYENNVKRCRYSTSKKIIQGWYKNYTGGSIKIIPNNKEYINKSISDNNIHTQRFDFLRELIAIGVSEATAKDWMTVRKAAKAVNTETAFQGIRREINRTGATAEDCIRLAVENNWRGFKADWYENAISRKSTPSPTPSPQRKPTIEDMISRYNLHTTYNEPDEQ